MGFHAQRPDKKWAHWAAALCVCLLAVTFSAAAKCERTPRIPTPPGTAPDMDGPGSFGPLQDTLTRDCLTYVSSVWKDGKEQVQIRDEKGKIYLLKVGSFMGENSTIITAIDRDTIFLKQVVMRGGDWIEEPVKFPKKKATK